MSQFSNAYSMLQGKNPFLNADNPKNMYRWLARRLHPDSTDDPRAKDAFWRLSEFWDEYNGKNPTPWVTISTRKRSYAVGDKRYTGKVANLYEANYTEGDKVHQGLMKMPRAVRDTDLMEAEATALKKLHAELAENWIPYLPELIETFRHRDKTSGKDRRVNVIKPIGDDWYTLQEVMVRYKFKLDPRDAAWMWRRVLGILGAVHRAGLVYGGIDWDNIVIQPEKHGLMLLDWCYSTPIGTKVKSSPRPEWAPPEYKAQEPADQRYDVYGAGNLLWGMASTPRFITYARGLIADDVRVRPKDAWVLLDELDDLLARAYGPRKFRPFSMTG